MAEVLPQPSGCSGTRAVDPSTHLACLRLWWSSGFSRLRFTYGECILQKIGFLEGTCARWALALTRADWYRAVGRGRTGEEGKAGASFDSPLEWLMCVATDVMNPLRFAPQADRDPMEVPAP